MLRAKKGVRIADPEWQRPTTSHKPALRSQHLPMIPASLIPIAFVAVFFGLAVLALAGARKQQRKTRENLEGDRKSVV